MAVKIIAQDPKTLVNLSAVAFTNCCDGVVVGANGTVLTTNDGGVSWSSQNSGFSEDFRDVAFADKSRVVAVGDECKILISQDRGVTWASPVSVPSFLEPAEKNHLDGVSFKDENIGYAVGIVGAEPVPRAVVLTTSNGGDTWDFEFVLPESAITATDVAFSVVGDVTFVVVAGTGTTGIEGLILRAEISTTNWTIPPVLPSRTSGRLLGISFAKPPHANHGWAVGDFGTIVHTTDGGATWTVQTSGISNEHLVRVTAIDDKHAWAVGINGSLIFTSDGGENWTRQDTGTGGQQLWDLAFCGPCLGTIVGVSGTVLTLLGHP